MPSPRLIDPSALAICVYAFVTAGSTRDSPSRSSNRESTPATCGRMRAIVSRSPAPIGALPGMRRSQRPYIHGRVPSRIGEPFTASSGRGAPVDGRA